MSVKTLGHPRRVESSPPPSVLHPRGVFSSDRPVWSQLTYLPSGMCCLVVLMLAWLKTWQKHSERLHSRVLLETWQLRLNEGFLVFKLNDEQPAGVLTSETLHMKWTGLHIHSQRLELELSITDRKRVLQSETSCWWQRWWSVSRWWTEVRFSVSN